MLILCCVLSCRQAEVGDSNAREERMPALAAAHGEDSAGCGIAWLR